MISHIDMRNIFSNYNNNNACDAKYNLLHRILGGKLYYEDVDLVEYSHHIKNQEYYEYGYLLGRKEKLLEVETKYFIPNHYKMKDIYSNSFNYDKNGKLYRSVAIFYAIDNGTFSTVHSPYACYVMWTNGKHRGVGQWMGLQELSKWLHHQHGVIFDPNEKTHPASISRLESTYNDGSLNGVGTLGELDSRSNKELMEIYGSPIM